eukprot:TRINITY_DN3640_c0_g1_i4.p1 TRINITY_DN3640_c0_g1~~TRINITY_DN3640_c0_g1_i4.p1  ORF type:complete len:676 (-),score=153.64 TRINITY_DN3640_c0_g1_i4:601-2628(-)
MCDEQWPDFGCEGIKVQRAHQPTSQCQGKKKDQVFGRISLRVFQVFNKLTTQGKRKNAALLIDVEAYEIVRMGVDQALKQCPRFDSLLHAQKILNPEIYVHNHNIRVQTIEKAHPFRDLCIKFLKQQAEKVCTDQYAQFTYIVDEATQDPSKQQIEVNLDMKERSELLDEWVDLLFDYRDHVASKFPPKYNVMEAVYGTIQDYVERCIIWVVGHEQEFQNEALLIFMQWILGFAAEESELGVNMLLLHEQLELMNTQFVKRADQLMMQCVENIDSQTHTLQLSQDQVNGKLFSGAVQELFFMINTQVDVVREWGNISLLHKLGFKIQEHLKSFAFKQADRVSGIEDQNDTENAAVNPAASSDLPQLHEQNTTLEFAIATANNAVRGYKLTEEIEKQLNKLLKDEHDGWQEVLDAFLSCASSAVRTILDVIWYDVKKLFYVLFTPEWLEDGTQVKTILATFRDYFDNDAKVLLDDTLLQKLYTLSLERFTVQYAAELLGIRGTSVPEAAKLKEWKLKVIQDLTDMVEFFSKSGMAGQELIRICDGLVHAIMELILAAEPYKMVAAYQHILDNFGELQPAQLKKLLEHRGWEEWLSGQVTKGVKEAYAQWEASDAKSKLPDEGVRLLKQIDQEISKRGWRLLQRKRTVLKAVTSLAKTDIADIRESVRNYGSFNLDS